MDDQDLLTKFSCMGTQDHDVLISDLHEILGSQLSREGCAFFLEMSNWNLQAAIGAYYDFYGQSSVQHPQVCVEKDYLIAEGGPIPPLTCFTKTWRLKNAGSETWPPGAYICQWSGHTLGTSASVTSLPLLKPGETADVSVQLTSPNTSGVFQSQWKMFTSAGTMCGGTLFITVIVEDSAVMGVTQQLSAISTNEGDMDTGGGAEGGASTPEMDERTLNQRNPFSSPPSSASLRFNQSPLSTNFSPNSSTIVSSVAMATGTAGSNRHQPLDHSPLELSALVSLSDQAHSRIPDIISTQGQSTLLQLSNSNSPQQNGNGTGTGTQQDCSNLESMITSDDFGSGNIYPS